jgi:hypothetical protein
MPPRISDRGAAATPGVCTVGLPIPCIFSIPFGEN